MECLQALLEIMENYIIFNNPTCPYDEWERKQRLLLPDGFSQNNRNARVVAERQAIG